jgi:hypothetical protein
MATTEENKSDESRCKKRACHRLKMRCDVAMTRMKLMAN